MGNGINGKGLALFLLAVIGLVLLIKCDDSTAARLHKEDIYNSFWCEKVGGKYEVRLEDGSRVDCLTDTHAVEADFADKHYNGLGQALHYSAVTGKKPGLLIIVEDIERDARHIHRMRKTLDFMDEVFSPPFCSIVDVWVIYPDELDD